MNVLNRKVHYWASFIVALPLLVMIGSGLLLQSKKHWAWVQPVEHRGTGIAPAVLPDISRLTAGTFAAQFNLVSGDSDQTAGLVFDLRPTGEYLFVRYNTREGNLALWRYAGGKREVVARPDQKGPAATRCLASDDADHFRHANPGSGQRLAAAGPRPGPGP